MGSILVQNCLKPKTYAVANMGVLYIVCVSSRTSDTKESPYHELLTGAHYKSIKSEERGISMHRGICTYMGSAEEEKRS